MKTIVRILPFIAALALLAACEKNPSTSLALAQPDSGKPADLTKTAGLDPTADFRSFVKQATYENRDAIKPAGEQLEQRLDAELVGLKSAGRALAPEKEQKLSEARTALTKDIETLATAGAETWSTARDHVLVSLQQVQSAFVEAQSPRAAS